MAIAKAGERDHGHEPRNGAVRLVYAGHQRALPISPSLLERSGGFFAAGSELRERVASGPLARPRRVRDNRGMAPRRALASIPAVLALGLAAACASTSPPPEPLAVGSALPEAVLDDQFGNEHRIDDSLKRVLLSRDMDGGRVVREVLAEHPDALQRLEAVYIADISGMPGVIASMMAIPKMRERPYPTLLEP